MRLYNNKSDPQKTEVFKFSDTECLTTNNQSFSRKKIVKEYDKGIRNY